jgi:hypothetical protein
MKVIYKGKYSRLADAVEDANEILATEEFYQRIREKEGHFDFASITPAQVANALEGSKMEATVKAARKSVLSKVTAWVTAAEPQTLYLNSRKLQRSLPSIVNTIIHECIHIADHEDAGHRFGHNGNRRKRNENSAPYWIGNMVQAWMEEAEDAKQPEVVFD